MAQADVGSGYPCGTIACHAGWYLLAKLHEADDVGWAEDEDHPLSLTNKAGSYRGFSEGLRLLMQDLGYGEHGDLKDWAERNPELWGNRNGDGMFSNPLAFKSDAEWYITVKDIAEHWLAVADRIEALNKPKVETGSWNEIAESVGWKAGELA